MKTYVVVNPNSANETHVYLIVNADNIIVKTEGSRFSDKLYLGENIETVKENLKEKGYTVTNIG